MTCKIAIVGAGPAGCMVACHLDEDFEITLFDKNLPLKTLLPTGGGKCNLAHAEYNFKELAKYYPRGEKFLYSVLSKFGTADTLDFFEKIGVTTYTREDNRIFPTSNSAQEVRDKILNQLHHCKFQKEEVLSITKIENGFEIKTNKAKYFFGAVVIATGGKSSYNFIKELQHTVTKTYPALVGLKTSPCYANLQGVTVQNCKIISDKKEFIGNILFTNNGITGPEVFELSSLNAQKPLPYKIKIDFINQEIDLQELFNKNPHKNICNLISEYIPKSLAETILATNNINCEQKCHTIKKDTKNNIYNLLTSFEFTINGTRKDGETVTCGGVCLDEINSKTMESKKVSGIFFCGEVLDIDGLCGGYNLQSCWSTGYIAAQGIKKLYK